MSDIGGGEIKGDYNKNTSRTMKLPAGTVLAYQIIELAVNDQGLLNGFVNLSL